MTRRILSGIAAAFFLTVAAASAQAAPADISPSFNGEPAACPASAPKEVMFIPYVRDSPRCTTIASCTNLDKVDENVTVQFFFGIGSSQGGSDATLTLTPGDTAEFGTRSTDPNGIRTINANAGGPAIEGK